MRKKDEDPGFNSIALFFSSGELLLYPARCEDIIQSWNDQQTIELYASSGNFLISQISHIYDVYFVTYDLILKDVIYLVEGIKIRESPHNHPIQSHT